MAWALAERIPLYRYVIEGNEVFEEQGRIFVREVLRNHHIAFAETDGTLSVSDHDLPRSAVMAYYIKEGVSYDITNGAFRIRPLAICPVLIEPDEFTDEPLRYPLGRFFRYRPNGSTDGIRFDHFTETWDFG